jgi:hypothetical protein
MPYTASNVPLEIFGATASFATDFGPSGVGLTGSHVSIVKVVFGDDDTATRVSSADPLPVIVNGTTGSAVEVTGDVAGRGDFYVRNSVLGSGSTAIYVAVAGNTSGTSLIGVTAMVQGICGGYPVGVSGSIEVNNLAVPIKGITEDHYIGFGGVTGSGYSAGIYPVVMTGGRRLTSSIDSVTVSGTVSATGGRFLSSGTDTVAVRGYDGGTKVPAALFAGDGVTLGHSGDALNVHLTNSGVSFTLDVSAVLGVTNAGENPLYVQGYTGTTGVPLTVRGENGGAVEVTSTSALNVSVGNEVSIADDDILTQLGTTGDIYGQLSSIKTNTATIQTISDDIRSGAGSVKISQITRPSSFTAGGKRVSATSGSVPLGPNQILRSGVTIKASSTNSDVIYIGPPTIGRATTNGYPLDPGESVFLEVGNLNLVNIRASTGTQNYHYIAS